MASPLADADLRALVSLANEAGALAAQPKACALHIAKGLGQLLSAWCVDIGRLPRAYADDAYAFPPARRPFETFAYAGPVPAEMFERVVTSWRDPAEREIAMMKLAADDHAVITATREELVDDGPWLASRFYQSVCKPGGVGERLYSSVATGQREPIVVVLSRPVGAPVFSIRDREVISLIRDSLLPWLADLFATVKARRSSPDAIGRIIESLSGCQLTVLVHLLNGLTEAEIGDRVGRSKHTVHDHVKRLYETLGVSSRVELGLKLAAHREHVEATLAAPTTTIKFTTEASVPAHRPTG